MCAGYIDVAHQHSQTAFFVTHQLCKGIARNGAECMDALDYGLHGLRTGALGRVGTLGKSAKLAERNASGALGRRARTEP